jgi:hypothetical protein
LRCTTKEIVAVVTKYWELAAQANDPVAKEEFCDLARVCLEVADEMDDRRVSG